MSEQLHSSTVISSMTKCVVYFIQEVNEPHQTGCGSERSLLPLQDTGMSHLENVSLILPRETLTVRVGNTRCDGLGHCTSHHELEEISGGLGVGRLTRSICHQFRFDGFVDNEMNHCLRNSEVRGSDALVEAYQTLGIKRTQFKKHLHKTVQKFLKQEIPYFSWSRSLVTKMPQYSVGHNPMYIPPPLFGSKFSYKYVNSKVVPYTTTPIAPFI